MRFEMDWRPGIDFARMRRERFTRAQQQMERFGIDGIIAFEYANGRYLANLRPLWAPNFMVRQAVVAVRGSDDVVVFVHQDDMPHRKSVMDWVPPENIRAFPTGVVNENAPDEALRPLVDALEELGLQQGRVGIDIGTVTVVDKLRRILDRHEVVDANACMIAARRTKNRVERDLLEDASVIVDHAMEVAVEQSVRTGMRECDVLADVMHVFYTYGAEVPQCNLIVCSGPNTAPMQRFAGDRLIRRGDLVFMDIGACFNGIFSEATRTVICGEPNATQQRIYRTVYDTHMATIEALQPGAKATDVQAASAKHYEGSQFEGYMQEMIIAHGIGVGYAEAPFIAPPGKTTPDLTLEPGMVLAVVPTIIVPDVPGGGGVRLEDVVVVGEDGPELLTQYPYDDKLLGA